MIIYLSKQQAADPLTMADNNIIALTIPAGDTGEVHITFPDTETLGYNSTYEYYLKTVQVYPAQKVYDFVLEADPLADNNYVPVNSISRNGTETEALNLQEILRCYKFPTRIRITNNEAGAETFLVYVSAKESDKD